MPFVSLDRDSDVPLTRQLYQRLREMILAGALAPGSRLHSTRELARELGVSRNVTMEAFDQLLAEGFLRARMGSGTFVAAGAEMPPRSTPAMIDIEPIGHTPFRTDVIDFRAGLPDLTGFPVTIWQRLSRKVWDSLKPLDLSYGRPEGRPELRREIAGYITAFRGVRCHPDQVLVTAGAAQAVGIVARMLLRGGRRECILEDPFTADIQRIISRCGGVLKPVAVDEEGMRTDALPSSRRPAFLYVTPSHQFPIGGTMPIQRRIALFEYARTHGAYVVEDDYDSEFRFDSPPICAIQGLDPHRVVYIGSFSKTLCPALRLAYVVLPVELIERGRELKWFSDLHNASVSQMILARFIAEGHFARYVHNMKKVYRERRRVLVECLEKQFAGGGGGIGPGIVKAASKGVIAVEILGSPAGIHLCARFKGIVFTPGLLSRIERAGAKFYSVEEHAIRKGRWRNTLCIGYGMLDAARIEAGIKILFRCINS